MSARIIHMVISLSASAALHLLVYAYIHIYIYIVEQRPTIASRKCCRLRLRIRLRLNIPLNFAASFHPTCRHKIQLLECMYTLRGASIMFICHYPAFVFTRRD